MARHHMTRKELRGDAFQDTMFHMVDYMYQKRRQFIAAAVGILAIAFSVGGYFWYGAAQKSAIAEAFYAVEQVRNDSTLEGEARRGKLLEALGDFTAAYPDSPLAVAAWLEAGELHFQAKDGDAAADAFAKAQRHPESTSLQQALAVTGQARLAEQQGKPEEAQGFYESLQDGYADLREYNLARVMLAQGDREAARQHLQAVLAQVPASPLARPARALLDFLQ